MNARERRACLSALADLANSGAIGILTSRPNYFTEAEELNVFDALYASLEKSHYYSGKTDIDAFAEEKQIDYLLENYVLNKSERYLRDLDDHQTISLVRKKLSDDADGQRVVLDILARVFRSEENGRQQSLSGKPVIVSFLLELIEELKREETASSGERLTEWLTYKMIVDRLMLRDLRRSPNVHPDSRRYALQRLAVLLSMRDTPAASEDDFFVIIDDVFRQELRRYQGEEKRTRRDELFQDIRSSSTLTRQENRRGSRDSWIFSHNSIREYLVSELIISGIKTDLQFRLEVVISDAMMQFVASIEEAELENILGKVRGSWSRRDSRSASSSISILWGALSKNKEGLIHKLRDICSIDGEFIDLSNISLNKLVIEGGDDSLVLARIGFESSELSSVEFSDLELRNSSFVNSVLDTVTFRNCDLYGVSFNGCYLFECNFVGSSFEGADFRSLEKGSNFSIQVPDEMVAMLSDEVAIGYLRYKKAITDDVDTYYVAMHHPKFAIVRKICDNISSQRKSQLRGLTQRGSAQSDPSFAREFVNYMSGKGFIAINNHDLVSVTNDGRGVIMRLLEHNELFDGLYEFLMNH